MLSALVFLAAMSTPADAERLFAQAEQDEHDLAFDQALEHYDASLAIDPSNRYALRASTRARWLRARSEGAFAPLVRLEETRRDPGAPRSATVVDALARDLESFPDGEVQTEARMFVAESYATHLGRPAEAEHELEQLLERPAGEGAVRAQAAVRLADLAMGRGDVATAKRAAREVQSVDATLALRVGRWARRRIFEKVAVALLATFAAAAVAAAIRHPPKLRDMRAFAPRAFAVCAYLALVAGVLADGYEQGNSAPFLLFPVALFFIVLVARAWGLAGASTASARVARALMGAAAIVASAFLVLDHIDVRYLESFGL